jgi:hypothetical protein
MFSLQRSLLTRLGTVCAVAAAGWLVALSANTPLPAYDPRVAESEMWELTGTIGGSVQERCVDPGEYASWLPTDPHPCDNEAAPLQPHELWQPTDFTIVETVDYDGDGAITIADYRVFVSDRLNRRIVVFDVDGETRATHAAFTRPDGRRVDFAFVEGIDADAAGNLIITDPIESRLIVVDRDFKLLLEHVYENDGLAAHVADAQPGRVSVAPGTIFTPRSGPGGTCGPERGSGRIVVTLWSPYWEMPGPAADATTTDMNTAVVYDGSLCRVAALGLENYYGLHTAGSFTVPNTPLFDSDGRVYVVDYVNNKIEVFAPDLADPANYVRLEGLNTPDGALPLGGSPVTPTEVNGPYHLMEDDTKRIVVVDLVNMRLAVFLPPWHAENTTGRWELLFELADRTLAAEWPTAVQRDSLGRWLITTAAHDRILVYQQPGLATFGLAAAQHDDTVRVDFSLVVPAGRQSAAGVLPQLEHRSSDGAVLANRRGPYDARVFGQEPRLLADESIEGGAYLPVYFLFDVIAGGDVEFEASASADGPINAPRKVRSYRVVAPGCERMPPTVTARMVPRPWEPALLHGQPVFANDATVVFDAADSGSGVAEIGYAWVEGGLRNSGGVLQPGETLTVSYMRSGPQAIQYWAVDRCGNRSDRASDPSDDTVIRVRLDVMPPGLRLGMPIPATEVLRPDANGVLWSNAADVTVEVVATDRDMFGYDVEFDEGGDDRTPTGSLLHFTSEGAGQARLIAVKDPVGNRNAIWSSAQRVLDGPEIFVNIDRTPPALTVAVDNAPDGQNGWYVSPATATAKATEMEGWSGVASLNSPHATASSVCTVREEAPRANCWERALVIGVEHEGADQYVSATAADAAGNEVTSVAGPFAIDLTPPTVGARLDGELVNGRYVDRVTVTLTTHDAVSGAAATLFSEVGSDGPWSTYDAPLARSASGTIWFKGIDLAGHSSGVGSISFVVAPNAAPRCDSASGGEIWPPNHMTFYEAPVRGVVDPEGQPVSIRVTAIWQDEPVYQKGDGWFAPDGQGVGTAMASVRAERIAKGNGRVYTIVFTATDALGASCGGTVHYTVPKSQGQHHATIDDGAAFDSTVGEAQAVPRP